MIQLPAYQELLYRILLIPIFRQTGLKCEILLAHVVYRIHQIKRFADTHLRREVHKNLQFAVLHTKLAEVIGPHIELVRGLNFAVSIPTDLQLAQVFKLCFLQSF